MDQSKIISLYCQSTTGVIQDCKTGLEWYSGPDEDMTWDDAYQWAKSLTVDNGIWELPMIYQLESIYIDEDEGIYRIAPIFGFDGYHHRFWSIEGGEFFAWYFAFYRGKKYAYDRLLSLSMRALAVRSYAMVDHLRRKIIGFGKINIKEYKENKL